MPIKIKPFINPFRNIVDRKGNMVEVVTIRGKTYQKVVRAK